ncbi:MAG: hypothetical protein PVH80_04990 [Anaerolineae bacterium]|jgi:hypothetical protein
MFPVNLYEIKAIGDMRAEEAVRRAQHQRLLREMAKNERGWLTRQIALLLRWAGYLLVAAGRRLQQIGSAQNAPIEGQSPARAMMQS